MIVESHGVVENSPGGQADFDFGDRPDGGRVRDGEWI